LIVSLAGLANPNIEKGFTSDRSGGSRMCTR